MLSKSYFIPYVCCTDKIKLYLLIVNKSLSVVSLILKCNINILIHFYEYIVCFFLQGINFKFNFILNKWPLEMAWPTVPRLWIRPWIDVLWIVMFTLNSWYYLYYSLIYIYIYIYYNTMYILFREWALGKQVSAGRQLNRKKGISL
jgi:hypothetical protein